MQTEHNTVNVDAGNFEDVVLRQDGKPVLVDFWAPWCGPCRMIGPVLDDLARDLDGKIVVAKVNVDESPELAQATRIRAVPTLHLVHRGKLVDVMLGVQSKSVLRAKIDALLAN